MAVQVAESSPAKQFLFKRSLQTAHRRRMLVEAGKPVGHALELQHRLLDQVSSLLFFELLFFFLSSRRQDADVAGTNTSIDRSIDAASYIACSPAMSGR